MLKFKKDDIGLYIACAMAGGGIGLLIGAYVASKVQFEDEEWPEDDEGWEPLPKMDINLPDIEYDGEYYRKVPENSPVKKSRKKNEKIKWTDDPELASFIAEYEPSTIQIEMLKTGIRSQSEVAAMILEERSEKLSEPYNYSAPYYDKPDLADLVDIPDDELPDLPEEVIDGRYVILEYQPADRDIKNQRVIYYDPEDGSTFTLSRNKRPVPTTLNSMISDETWANLEPYFHKGYRILYVKDLKTVRFYKFEVIEDEEESSSNDRAPNK